MNALPLTPPVRGLGCIVINKVGFKFKYMTLPSIVLFISFIMFKSDTVESRIFEVLGTRGLILNY